MSLSPNLEDLDSRIPAVQVLSALGWKHLEQTWRGAAERVWRECPIHDYGKGWDDADM